MPGYHVWAKVIEALADVGYDTNNLVRLVLQLIFEHAPRLQSSGHPASRPRCNLAQGSCRACDPPSGTCQGGASLLDSCVPACRACRTCPTSHHSVQPSQSAAQLGHAQIGETYDWRLGVPNLEVRDGYFTRLRRRIEITHHLNHEKAGPCSTRSSDQL